MNKVIKDIIDSQRQKADKIKELDILKEQIELAKGVLSGEVTYCPECDDYYLTKSFFEETRSKETKICIYEDIINSGGNEYADGIINITYIICPKGHMHELAISEQL